MRSERAASALLRTAARHRERRSYLIHTGLTQEIGAEYRAHQGMDIGRDGEIAVRVENHAIKFGGYAVTCADGKLPID